MVQPVLILLSTLLIVDSCIAQYSIPDVKLEAYTPKGFKASIPDTPGVQVFAFNGKLNGIITNTELGQINGEAKLPNNGVWEIFDPELQLMVGDKISYWVFVQYDRLGYRKDVLNWEVNELKVPGESKPDGCSDSVSVASGGAKFCSGAIIFEDNFDASGIDDTKWTIENYLPTYFEEPYEFVSYRNIDACRFIKSSILYLKPVIDTGATIRSVVDLRRGCTRTLDSACYHRPQTAQINPIISSGKIISKLAFKYGRIEIRAKFPVGDWIYPRMELIPRIDDGSDYTRLIIGYSRGNPTLVKNINDIGSRILFGGPVLNAEERDSHLRRKSEAYPLYENFHIFTVIWSPDKIDLLVDNEQYGSVPTDSSAFASFNDEFRLTLGVGVGGMRDFPEGYSSSGVQKPWMNFDPKAMKNFFDDKNRWLQTWRDDNVALQIDSVKIIAL